MIWHFQPMFSIQKLLNLFLFYHCGFLKSKLFNNMKHLKMFSIWWINRWVNLGYLPLKLLQIDKLKRKRQIHSFSYTLQKYSIWYTVCSLIIQVICRFKLDLNWKNFWKKLTIDFKYCYIGRCTWGSFSNASAEKKWIVNCLIC